MRIEFKVFYLWLTSIRKNILKKYYEEGLDYIGFVRICYFPLSIPN